MNPTTAVIAVVFALLGVAAPIAGVAWVRRRRARAWRAFGELRGLRLVHSGRGGALALSGTWEGVPVEVWFGRGTGGGPRTVTRVAAQFRVDLPKGLDIRSTDRPPGTGSEVQTGDPDLDGALHVRTRDPTGVQALLGNARVLDALRAFAGIGPGAAITGTTAGCAFPGFVGDPGALATALDRAARTVRAVEAARIWPSVASRPPEPEKPRTAEVVFHSRPAPSPPVKQPGGEKAPASISLVGHAIQTDEHVRSQRKRVR